MRKAIAIAPLLVVVLAVSTASALDFGPQFIVQDGAADLQVLGYSTPSLVDWNSDGLLDIMTGERTYPKVRVYLNVGAVGSPAYNGFSYVQADGVDIQVLGRSCMGSFPRAVDWNSDGKKDLIVGDSYGKYTLFVNIGTDAAPVFGAGIFLQAGGVDIDVGERATFNVVDYNNDGMKDMVTGGLDGLVRVFLNEGADAAPIFSGSTTLPLVVPDARASVVIAELDGDGRKDLLVGNTTGYILLYSNQGTDAAPAFSTYTAVTSCGVPIHLPNDPRTRPSIGDYNGDGIWDLIVGDVTGKVYVYQGLPEPGTMLLLAAGGVGVLRHRRR